MKITATTTDDEIVENVRAATTHLANLATEGRGWEDLVQQVNEIAKRQGEAEAYAIYRDGLAAEASSDSIVRSLFARLVNGADDTWSGRSNDARRAKFDGFRRTADEIRWSLR